jgi:hypothetical protein
MVKAQQWSTVNRQSSTVGGQWSMVKFQISNFNGRRSMVDGQILNFNGQWSMVKQSIVNDHPPMFKQSIVKFQKNTLNKPHYALQV